MKNNKINLKKEDYMYRLNIKHQELLEHFEFLDVEKVIRGEIEETKSEIFGVTLRFFQDTGVSFKEEFQIELFKDNKTYQAFYIVDEDGYVYINKYEYLELVKIFEEIGYEIETNLMDLRFMGINFLSDLLSAAFYQNENFVLEMEGEDYKETRKTFKNTVSYEEVIAQALLNGKKARIYNRQEFKEHWVTIEKLQNGFEILKKDYPETFLNIIKDRYDLTDADMFIQCALFGEVIYG